ncbi:MAG: hypothetical protein IK117_10030 [Bacteroidales bacterium]|nr:hypothetical protein [Bacteroidales bacterium]
MKKFLSILFLCGVLAGSVYANNPDPTYVYCDMVGYEKLLSLTGKVKVSIDYGEAKTLFTDQRIKDESGKVQSFNSMIDAMNYMAQQGWEIDQCYVVKGDGEMKTHWILKKKVNK